MPEPIQVVCTGRIRLKGTDTKTATGLIALDVEGYATGPERCYDTPKLRTMRAGAVYTIDATLKEDGAMSVVPGTQQYVEIYPDKEKCVAWQARSQAEEIAAAANRREKKEATGKQELLDALAPIRKLYFETNYLGRMALELVVLHALRTPVLDKKQHVT